eukprot:scaffold29776_cov30-Tisochrysis_lutea.AAC.1
MPGRRVVPSPRQGRSGKRLRLVPPHPPPGHGHGSCQMAESKGDQRPTREESWSPWGRARGASFMPM